MLALWAACVVLVTAAVPAESRQARGGAATAIVAEYDGIIHPVAAEFFDDVIGRAEASGATAAVILSRHTHPLALLLLSAAVVGAGLAGVAFHRALNGFFGIGTRPPPHGERARALLEREKALVLRSIKELEFDHQMGKVSEADFVDIGCTSA